MIILLVYMFFNEWWDGRGESYFGLFIGYYIDVVMDIDWMYFYVWVFNCNLYIKEYLKF